MSGLKQIFRFCGQFGRLLFRAPACCFALAAGLRARNSKPSRPDSKGGLRTRLCVAPGVLVRFFREFQENVFQGPIQGSLFAERFQGAAADQPAVLYDADAVSKELVRIARSALSAHLRGRGAVVGFLEWDISKGKGIDDHLAAVGPDTVLDEIAHVDFASSAWKKDLLRSKPA